MRVSSRPHNSFASASQSSAPRKARCLPCLRMPKLTFFGCFPRWNRSKAATAQRPPEEEVPGTKAPCPTGKSSKANQRKGLPVIDLDQPIDFDQMRACDLAAAEARLSERLPTRGHVGEFEDSFDHGCVPRLTAEQAESLYRLNMPSPSPSQMPVVNEQEWLI
eukprot:IDg868t1